MMDPGSVAIFDWLDTLIFVLVLCVIYVMFLKKPANDLRYSDEKIPNELPPMPKRDFTVKQLLLYDGKQNERILLAVCGKVFDVTKGSSFYGPGGPYNKLAGHDATRALALMDPDAVKDTADDLNDIPESDLNTAKEWSQSFIYKYPVVGKLLPEDEEPTDYNGEVASL